MNVLRTILAVLVLLLPVVGFVMTATATPDTEAQVVGVAGKPPYELRKR